MVPNGVGTGRPPAKLPPPRTVWQSLQLPIAASSRPCLINAGSNDADVGGSIAAIAGRHVMAKPAAAPAIKTAPMTAAMIRGHPVICPFSLFIVERAALLSTY